MMGIACTMLLLFTTLPLVTVLVAKVALRSGGPLSRDERHAWGLLTIFLWVIAIGISLLPALWWAHLAERMAKVVKIKCRACGWAKAFVLTGRQGRSPVAERDESDTAEGPAGD